MAKCKCIPHPDDVAKYPLWATKVGDPLWPQEVECPEDQTAAKEQCAKKIGPKGHLGGENPWPIAEYPPGSGTKIPIPGNPWVWVDESAEALIEAETAEEGAPKESGVTPPPAPPEVETVSGSVPEGLSDFNDQCFLLEFAEPIYKKFGPTEEFLKSVNLFEAPVRSLGWLKAGDAAKAKWQENISYISHITAGAVPADTMRNFFEMTAAEKAQIVPFIQISVDYYDHDAVRKASFVLDFPNETILDPSILRSTGERNLAGIKNISIDLDGIDEVMAKVVKVNASFVFQDFRTIFKQQPDVKVASGAKLRKYYSDLFSYGSRDISTGGATSGLYKKLRFKIGWAGRTHTINSEKDSLTKKLGLNERTLVLDVGIHQYNFDFNSDGSLTVNISYIGAMENALDGPSSNLLSVVKKTLDTALQLKATETLAKAQTISKTNQERIKEDEVKLLATMFFQNRLLEGMNKVGGAEAIFWDPSAGVANRGGISKTKTWDWLGADGVKPGQMFGLNTLAHDLMMEYSAAKYNISNEQITNMADWVQVLYKQMFNTTTMKTNNEFHWTGASDIKIDVSKGITYNKIKALERAITDGSGKLKAGEGLSDATGQATRARMDTAQQNIRDQSATAQRQILKQLALMKFSGLRQLATQLLGDQKLYYAKLGRDDKFKLNFNSLQKETSQSVFAEIIKKADSILGQIPKSGDYPTPEGYQAESEKRMTKEELLSGYVQFIPFVLLGDLLTTLLNIPTDTPTGPAVHELITKSYSEKFKVDLGYIYYSGPLTNTAVLRFPLYYLPISLKRLNNFFVRNIIGKELTFYSFKDFVVDLLSEFLAGAQQHCLLDANTSSALIPSLEFVFGNVLEKRQWATAGSETRFSKGLAKSNFKTWFIYGTQTTYNEIPRKDPQSGGAAFGRYSFNMKNKIFHFYLGGQNKGIVKSIKLIDNTNPELKAAMYLKHRQKPGEQDLGSQGVMPPLVFKVEIQTIGCSTFHLGQYVFLDARQYVDVSVDRVFQISGYYRIYKVQHTSGRDNFATTITAILEESLDDLNNNRKTDVTAGTKVSLTVPGPDQGNANVITETSGLNPGIQTALEDAQNKLNALDGERQFAGELSRAELKKKWASLRPFLAARSSNYCGKSSGEGSSQETGASTSTLAHGDWGKCPNSGPVEVFITQLGQIKNSALADMVYFFLNELIWNGTKGWGAGGALDADVESNILICYRALYALEAFIPNHPTLAKKAAATVNNYHSSMSGRGKWRWYSGDWDDIDPPWFPALAGAATAFMRVSNQYEAGLMAEPLEVHVELPPAAPEAAEE